MTAAAGTSPRRSHGEQHFTASELLRDIVIGMSDGLTVPFALAAGLSGAVGTTQVVVIAGLAEIAAGTIAKGWAATSQGGLMRSTTSPSDGARREKLSNSRTARSKKQ